jgi:hypothetical protein
MKFRQFLKTWPEPTTKADWSPNPTRSDPKKPTQSIAISGWKITAAMPPYPPATF